ncbi:MAG: aspartate kinase [Polyangiaceae bacterium]|nr:aspartate kinase [Polyangiaceae bacterium]
MPIVVQKYGGSSVADIGKLRQVADQVARTRAAGDDVVVVVSAMGKTTDNLLGLARQAALPPDATVESGSAAPEPAKRELDMLLSTGERVSMSLLSIAMHARGLDAVSFTGSQSGIITNDRHFDARIIEVRPHRIEDELARGRIVIVAGYQGMSYKREITTLGRGGSDTTAVALAAALGAERCEIYSDVDGVYSADPRVIADARHLPELDYETMQEMAECGAKVLNAQAVEWARRHKVAIIARKTGDVAGRPGVRETVVSEVASADAARRAVVVQKSVAWLTAEARAASRLLAAAERLSLPLGDLTVGPRELMAWTPLINVPNWGEVRTELLGASLGGLSIREGHGLLSLVGVEVGTRSDVVRAALACLDAPPELVFSHPLRLSCVLPDAHLDAAARAWHELLGPGAAAAADRLTA